MTAQKYIRSIPGRPSADRTNALAATILLNRAMTRRALLRVALDPIRSLAVVSALLQPHPGDGAHDWPVITLNRASKAKLVLFPTQSQATRRLRRLRLPTQSPGTAGHGGNDSRKARLQRRGGARDGVCARWVRTVLQTRVGRHEVPHQELLEPQPSGDVLLGLSWIANRRARPRDQYGPDKRVWCHEGTAFCHATNRVLGFVSDFRADISGPAA